MKRVWPVALLVALLAAPAFAQMGGAQSGNPVSAVLKSAYQGVQRNLIDTAEQVPESVYAFRPTPEVRSLGELIGHVAGSQYMYCGAAKGEKNPAAESQFEKVTSKAALVKALKDSSAYCDTVYAELTDAGLGRMVTMGTRQMPAIGLLVQNIAHDNEHYGNLVTYMRLKGIVPPSTARQQRRPGGR